jgi:hypothetical protein
MLKSSRVKPRLYMPKEFFRKGYWKGLGHSNVIVARIYDKNALLKSWAKAYL